MYLGLNLSHDASAALISHDGIVISAVSEERFTRLKNHIGIPVRSIEAMLVSQPHLTNVVVGTFQIPTLGDVKRFVANIESNPSNLEGTWGNPYPGFSKNFIANALNSNPKLVIESQLAKVFSRFNRELPPVIWINHHQAHLGCAFGISLGTPTLLISLDGEGDGDSGAIGLARSGVFDVRARIPKVDSLGNLYSAVTERYNFKAGKHEGKITGLAAYGGYSEACDILLNYVSVVNGIPEIRNVRSFKDKVSQKSRRLLGLSFNSGRTLEEIVSIAESKTDEYADLAFAIQYVLERSVIEIIDYWTNHESIYNIALAGGVFANVKLNQRIAEIESVKSVRVFPNMGDGGLSIGGVWAHMAKIGKAIPSTLVTNMYLAPQTKENDQQLMREIIQQSNYSFEILDFDDEVKNCATDVANGIVVAVHKGSMEFGPRALGNRSILVDPRNPMIVKNLNSRLSRTEFMPFAPMVTQEDASIYFDLPADLQPFTYMTMTCNVKSEFRSRLPAVTHIDGTARPQIVSKASNLFIWSLLNEFKKLTGFSVLVNTSLNIHEEPINFRLQDSINALHKNAIDVLYTDEGRIMLKK
jgi:carbamoyltransferase